MMIDTAIKKVFKISEEIKIEEIRELEIHKQIEAITKLT